MVLPQKSFEFCLRVFIESSFPFSWDLHKENRQFIKITFDTHEVINHTHSPSIIVEECSRIKCKCF